MENKNTRKVTKSVLTNLHRENGESENDGHQGSTQNTAGSMLALTSNIFIHFHTTLYMGNRCNEKPTGIEVK